MSDMYNMPQIQQCILERYQSNPKIRINVNITKPKLRLQNVPATITGVYAHIFQIEEALSGRTRRHTLQYTDVLTHNIEILD